MDGRCSFRGCSVLSFSLLNTEEGEAYLESKDDTAGQMNKPVKYKALRDAFSATLGRTQVQINDT